MVLKLYFGTCFPIVADREQFGVRQIEVSAEFRQWMAAKKASGLTRCSRSSYAECQLLYSRSAGLWRIADRSPLIMRLYWTVAPFRSEPDRDAVSCIRSCLLRVLPFSSVEAPQNTVWPIARAPRSVPKALRVESKTVAIDGDPYSRDMAARRWPGARRVWRSPGVNRAATRGVQNHKRCGARRNDGGSAG